jgi:hypothetical protein
MLPLISPSTAVAVSRAGRRIAVFLAAAVAALGLASGLPPVGQGPRGLPTPLGAGGSGDFGGEIEGVPVSAPAGEERGGESPADGESSPSAPSAPVARPEAPSRRLRFDARAESLSARPTRVVLRTSASVGGPAAAARPAALSARNGFGGPLRC